MSYTIEFEQETDGRRLVEIPSFPGVTAYGRTREEARSKAEALALRVIADRLEREQQTKVDIRLAVA